MTITKCPDCEKKGEKSSMTLEQGPGKKGDVKIFIDEDGLKHVHNTNVIQIIYVCSNGHTNTEFNYGQCPSCKWNGEQA